MMVTSAPIGALLLAMVATPMACARPVHPTAPPPTPLSGEVSAPVPVPLAVVADVDERLAAEWQRAGVTPTPAADDATWLRRIWLDLVGTIPPPEVTLAFLSGADVGKRARMVDALFASPLWADHWTAYWDDVWMGPGVRAPDVDRGAFRSWLHDVFARDLPWNQIVTQLLTATGQNSEGLAKRESDENDGHRALPAGVNGAVNFTLAFADNPQDMAGTVSRTLLGVQIQCAQCHDHKTEKWTQKDFQGFAAAFARTRPVPIDTGPPMGSVKRVAVMDLDRAAPRLAKMADLESVLKAQPRALDGSSLGTGEGVRSALARWITSPQNPWFAREFANRMWGHFLGRGFVDPVDDFRASNPATAPGILDALAADFVASGYDIKHLVRVIVGTRAYARSSAPLDAATAKLDPEAKLWERFRITPLGAEELLNSLVAATRLDALVQATGRLDLAQVRFRVRQRYGFLFDVDERSDETDYEGTIAQALTLLNGSVVATGAKALPGSALAEILAGPGGDADKVERLYVRALARRPTPDEANRWTQFLAEVTPSAGKSTNELGGDRTVRSNPRGEARPSQPDPLRGLQGRAGLGEASGRIQAYEDLLWTLLNCSEFAFNH